MRDTPRRYLVPTKTQKEAAVEALKASFGKANVAVVADYRGLSVKEITDLRRRVQKAGGDLTVAKNTLIKVATKGEDQWSGLDSILAGPTALVFGFDDIAAPVKALSDFAKEKRAVKVKIRGGVLDGKAVDVKGVESIANLPTKPVLLAQLLQVMNGPITGLVNVFMGNQRNLVYALEAIRKQKDEGAA